MKTKKNTSRNKKLISYSTLSTVFLTIGTQAAAQIFYSDIPDVVFDENGETYAFDLNGDLINDIQLSKVFITFNSSSLYTPGGGSASGIVQMNHIYATPLNNNAIAGTPSPYGFTSYPYAMYCASVINNGRQWQIDNSQVVAYSLLYKVDTIGGGVFDSHIISDGNWFGGKTDKYLGVRLDVGGILKYAWMRLDVSVDNKIVTVKDFAFENTADTEILAGEPNIIIADCDTVDIVQYFPQEDIAAYSFSNTIYITTKDPQLTGANISVLNITGQLIYTSVLSEQNKNIVLKDTPTGIYILRITHNNTIYTKQLFISGNN
ncbi:MAG: T9SS type A sorting domain-containing protein [Fimbriimonadaceae bacterium]|nr:T9SS type A sorting domain-containing protein [Chitinophagales bacterium]